MKVLLVDDEARVLAGVARVLECEVDDWDIETVQSGEEAIEFLKLEEVDAIVSDLRMPGICGAQLLNHVGENYPRVLRVVLSGQADRETVLRAVGPMHQYLAKPCKSEKLIKVIQNAKIFQETIKSTEVLNAIAQANSLPSFPEIVQDINNEIESDNSSSESIAAIISKDAILCARVLQVVNSAIFSLRNTVSDLEKAISIIGLDVVRALAMAQTVFSIEVDSAQVISGQKLMNHGIAVANAGRHLARHIGMSMADANTVFTSGLLHDVGKLILLNSFPNEYKEIYSNATRQQRNVEELELDKFGATHQGIGAYLFELWGLPGEVIRSVAMHHSFESCVKSEDESPRVVFAANWIVNDSNPDDLKSCVEESEDSMSAERFMNQIIEWRKFILDIEE